MSFRNFDPYAGIESPPEPDHTCPECGGAVSPSGHCLGCDWSAWGAIV